MPASIKWSSAKVMSGLWKIGTSGLGSSSVNGRSRFPSPAPRTNACLISVIALKLQHGRGTGLAWQHIAMEELWLVRPPTFGRDRHRGDFRFAAAELVTGNPKV